MFKQSDIVGLLQLGSVVNPRIGRGEEGKKQLVAVRSEEGTLAQVLELEKARVVGEVLGEDGLPPLPGRRVNWKLDQEGSYSSEYPCRNFA